MKKLIPLILISIFVASCDIFIALALDDNLPIEEDFLSVVNTDGSNYNKLITSYFYGDPIFTHNEDEIIYLRNGVFWKVDIQYPLADEILTFNGVEDGYFSISPIDDSFVFSDRSNTFIYNYETEILTNLTENNQEGSYRYPSYSPDGTQIILFATTYSDSSYFRSISSIDLTNYTINNILMLDSYIRFPTYSQDMTKIFYKKISNLYMYDIESSSCEIIASSNYDDRISTGGDYVVFSESSIIYTYNFATNDLIELVEGDDPRIASDGSKLIFGNYDSNFDYHLYKINIDGTEKVKHKKISENDYSFSMSAEKITYIRHKVTHD